MNNIQNISPSEAHTKIDAMFIRAGYLMRMAEENERDLNHVAEVVTAQQKTKEQINNENESGDNRR